MGTLLLDLNAEAEHTFAPFGHRRFMAYMYTVSMKMSRIQISATTRHRVKFKLFSKIVPAILKYVVKNNKTRASVVHVEYFSHL